MNKITGNLVPDEIIENRIFLIRGRKVMLDYDLAELYHVSTGRLKEQVKRNLGRFPADFMFQLSTGEFKNLMSQNAISSWGGKRKPPAAFTEQGIAMLSGVLKSERAIRVNIAIMRAFVRIGWILSTHKELAEKISKLERKYNKHDIEMQTVFKVLKQMMLPPKKTRPKIGFRVVQWSGK